MIATIVGLSRFVNIWTPSPLTTHHSPLTTHHLPLTTHHLPLTTYHSPLTTYHSLLTTYHSPYYLPHHSPYYLKSRLRYVCPYRDGPKNTAFAIKNLSPG